VIVTKANVVYFILEMVDKKGSSFSMNDFYEFFIKAALICDNYFSFSGSMKRSIARLSSKYLN
jgi:hypothetical protein